MTEEIEPRQTLYDPIIQKPEAELLAERILAQGLLEEAQRGGEGRLAAIEEDEAGLLKATAEALGIHDEVLRDAIIRYEGFMKGDVAELDEALKLDIAAVRKTGHVANVNEANRPMFMRAQELGRRWQALGQLCDIIGDNEQLTGEYAEVAKTLGLDERTLHGFVRILNDGDYGKLFGFPVDDVALQIGGSTAVQALLPKFAQFKNKLYRPTRSGTFLIRGIDTPLSTMIYTGIVSRAQQAEDRAVFKTLSERDQRKCAFANLYKEVMIAIIVAEEDPVQLHDGFGDFPIAIELSDEDKLTRRVQREKEFMEIIYATDKRIEEAISGVMRNPGGYSDKHAAGYLEMQRFAKMIPLVNKQIMADGFFSENEKAMMNYVLESIGIRRAPARKALFADYQNEDGTTETGLTRFRNSELCREAIVCANK